ncbi:MAG: substrate-binding domain-containing protein [Candidatus Heimdallarchaeota archaeon]|nr:substrate-binding domain-containing protein [Candidatus Heimdallarchaeota archaeon]
MGKSKLPTIITVVLLISSLIALDIIRQAQFRGDKDEIVLKVLYTSEKKGWINSIAPDFPEWFAERNPGKTVRLQFEVQGTRTSMLSILSGESKPTIWSPAAAVWIPLFDWEWEKKFGGSVLDLNQIKSLVASPIVLGTWQSFREENNFTSLADLYDLAEDNLKLAHTSAQESNSGFMAVLLEITAASGKTPDNIELADLQNTTIQDWLEKVESKAVLYGTSTGFLAKQAVQLGPSAINVIILYENLIIETAKDGEAYAKWGDDLVAVYPEEGTLWSDHPIAILNASWVTPDEAFAASEFETFLLSKEVQKISIPFGFRPGNETIKDDPDVIAEMVKVFKPENGVQLNISVPRFNVPTDGEVLDRVPDLWLKTRATAIEKNEDAEYWQVGLEPVLLVPIMLTSLIILTVIFKRRRRK